MKEKNIILTARIMSMVFTPFYLPIVGLIALFIFSYMSLLPMTYKLVMLAMVYLLTVVAPSLLIHLYRLCQGWTSHELGKKERRIVPYIISILCYGLMLYLMEQLKMPRFMMGVIVCALSLQIICALTNIWLKVSTHAAASGGVIGALMAFSLIFAFDPTGWLCLCVLLSGMVCTARFILRQHTLRELGWGVTVGLLCGFFSILLV